MARDSRNVRALRSQRGGAPNAAVGPDGDAGLAQQEAWPRRLDAKAKKPDSGATVFGNCLMILFQGVVVLLGIGFWLGSMLMVDVLNEIRKRDFSGPMARIQEYEDFFDELRKAGCDVIKDNPRITMAGITTYLWTVEPKGRDELCRFQWQHVIEDNAIIPQTNGALLLDVRLGKTTQAEAARYPFYNPNEQTIVALLSTGPSGTTPSGQQADQPPAETSVLPPLISPDDAKGRARGGKPKEEQPEPGAADGTGGEDPGDNAPPRVEPPDAPPGGEAGGGGDGGTEPPRVEPPATPPDDGGGEAPPEDGAGY